MCLLPLHQAAASAHAKDIAELCEAVGEADGALATQHEALAGVRVAAAEKERQLRTALAFTRAGSHAHRAAAVEAARSAEALGTVRYTCTYIYIRMAAATEITRDANGDDVGVGSLRVNPSPSRNPNTDHNPDSNRSPNHSPSCRSNPAPPSTLTRSLRPCSRRARAC